MASMVNRMFRAAKLDAQLYEEVEADKGSLRQAMGVVVLSSIAAGVGSGGVEGFAEFFIGTVGALIGWVIWAALTYFIGTKILPEPTTRADVGELLRTIGFSSSPGLIRVFGLVPGVAGIVFLVSGVWMLAAMIIAVRQALDYQSTFRAVGVCAISYIIHLVVLLLLMPFLRS